MTTEIARMTYFNSAHDLMQAIEALVANTPENDATIVNVDIAPQIDYTGGTAYLSGTVVLFEETQSDKSKVYNIEVY